MARRRLFAVSFGVITLFVKREARTERSQSASLLVACSWQAEPMLGTIIIRVTTLGPFVSWSIVVGMSGLAIVMIHSAVERARRETCSLSSVLRECFGLLKQHSPSPN